jgi:hypothetical protein
VTLLAQVDQLDGTTQIIPLAEISLRPTERSFNPPEQLDLVTAANFGQVAYLLGANLTQSRLSPGETSELTLYWRAEAATSIDYTIFVHPLGPDGTPALNFDHAPPRPTSTWLEGEIIADTVTLAISPDLPAGRYPIEVGLYNATDPSFRRLPVINGEANDFVILTEIEVVTP